LYVRSDALNLGGGGRDEWKAGAQIFFMQADEAHVLDPISLPQSPIGELGRWCYPDFRANSGLTS